MKAPANLEAALSSATEGRIGLPFIPSWLDDAGLSQAEFRVYCHLCRRADNNTGIAWPAVDKKDNLSGSSDKCIISVCGMARRTAWKVLKSLESKKLIKKLGREHFGASNRYRILLPSDANEAPKDRFPTDANGTHHLAQSRPNHSAQIRPQEGSLKKAPQRRKSNRKLFEPDSSSRDDLKNLRLPFLSEAFAAAWRDWEQHRKEKKKPITPLSANKQLKDLEAWGETRSIAAINYSIGKGWQGIFEPTVAPHSLQKPMPAVNIGGRNATYETIETK